MAQFPSPSDASGIWDLTEARDALMGSNWPSTPTAPTGVSANLSTLTSVTVSYTAGANANAHRVYYSTSTPVTTANSYVSGTSSSGTVTGLSSNTTYYFRVLAVNNLGETFSGEVSLLTPPAGTTVYSAGQTLQIDPSTTAAQTTGVFYCDGSVTSIGVELVGGAGGGGGGWNDYGASGGLGGRASANYLIGANKTFKYIVGGGGSGGCAYDGAGYGGGASALVEYSTNNPILVAGGGGGGGSGWNGTAGVGGQGGQAVNVSGMQIANGTNGQTTQAAGGGAGTSSPGTNSYNSALNAVGTVGGKGGNQGGSGGGGSSDWGAGGAYSTTTYWGGGGGGGGYKGGAGGWGSSAGDGGGGGSSYLASGVTARSTSRSNSAGGGGGTSGGCGGHGQRGSILIVFS